jgi:hypothetical protein
VSTSHVFGSNTSASSWEAFQQAIQNMITMLAQLTNLVEKHKNTINMLHWVDKNCACPEFVQPFPFKINHGVLDSNGSLLPMTANIYVNDILGAAAFK